MHWTDVFHTIHKSYTYVTIQKTSQPDNKNMDPKDGTCRRPFQNCTEVRHPLKSPHYICTVIGCDKWTDGQAVCLSPCSASFGRAGDNLRTLRGFFKLKNKKDIIKFELWLTQTWEFEINWRIFGASFENYREIYEVKITDLMSPDDYVSRV